MAGTLYEQDFIGWTEQQARLLREAAARGVNLPLDWANLAEEIEDLGRNVARSVKSQMIRIIEHLFKMEYSDIVESRRGWTVSIENARREVALILQDDPGLRPRLPQMLEQSAPLGVRYAARELRNYGEGKAAALVVIQGPEHYTLDQILDEDWLPARPDMPALTRA